MTFEKLSASLLSESHRRKHRNQLLGDEEALTASHQKRPQNHNSFGKGCWSNFRGRGFPGRSYYGPPRPPPIYFNCRKPGHLARDCRAPKNYTHLDQGTGYANSAEMLNSQLYQEWYDQNYRYWDNGSWYLDSGASSHIASDSGKMDHYPTSSGVAISEIKTRGGESHPVKGTGTTTVHIENGAIKLKSVKYVPSMKKNLLSVGAIADTGHRTIFTAKNCWIVNHDGKMVASGHRDPSNGLYCFRQKETTLSSELNPQTGSLYTHSAQNWLWHRRLGHLSFSNMQHLFRTSAVMGLPKIENLDQICPCCMAGRQHRERFPSRSEIRAAKPGQRIHSDLIGPMQAASLGGSRYILVLTDDYSRKGWVYFMRSKDETLTRFREFQHRIENETGNKIQALRTDRRGECLSKEFSKLCKESGIKRELTQAHTPQ